nr:AtpZ/AtpI family protein [Gracilibacillus halotolerans]
MAIGSAILSQLVGAPLIGIFIGRYLDNHYSTKPLFLITGLLLGLAAGLYGTFHYVKELTGDEN